MMKHAYLFAFVACLATFGFVDQTKISADSQADYRSSEYDIGLTKNTIPEGKGDVLVVYSASWCGPCQVMRPTWPVMRAQGHRVVYIDIDDPNASVGKFPYATEDLVTTAMKQRPNAVPTIRWYNSETNSLLPHSLSGVVTQEQAKKYLWTPSSSTGFRRAR